MARGLPRHGGGTSCRIADRCRHSFMNNVNACLLSCVRRPPARRASFCLWLYCLSPQPSALTQPSAPFPGASQPPFTERAHSIIAHASHPIHTAHPTYVGNNGSCVSHRRFPNRPMPASPLPPPHRHSAATFTWAIARVPASTPAPALPHAHAPAQQTRNRPPTLELSPAPAHTATSSAHAHMRCPKCRPDEREPDAGRTPHITASSARRPSTADIMACPSMFTGCCAHQPLDNRAKVT